MKRFAKHISLQSIGSKGQKKIIESKILVIGLGGIGSPLVRYLASSGVGCLGIVDDDIIEEDNLPRQNNFYLENLGDLKVETTAKILQKLNPQIKINIYAKYANKSFLTRVINEYDIIVDASDNFTTKFLCGDISCQSGKTLISGSFVGFKGYVGTYKGSNNNSEPCFRCFHYGEIDGTKERACFNRGVLSPGVGVIGNFMAAEILKEIVGISSLSGNIMMFDFFKNNHHLVKLSRRSNCICSNN